MRTKTDTALTFTETTGAIRLLDELAAVDAAGGLVHEFMDADRFAHDTARRTVVDALVRHAREGGVPLRTVGKWLNGGFAEGNPHAQPFSRWNAAFYCACGALDNAFGHGWREDEPLSPLEVELSAVYEDAHLRAWREREDGNEPFVTVRLPLSDDEDTIELAEKAAEVVRAVEDTGTQCVAVVRLPLTQEEVAVAALALADGANDEGDEGA